MRNRRIKKLVSLTLAAIMAFTINTGVYAEEIEDSAVVEEDA